MFNQVLINKILKDDFRTMQMPYRGAGSVSKWKRLIPYDFKILAFAFSQIWKRLKVKRWSVIIIINLSHTQIMFEIS